MNIIEKKIHSAIGAYPFIRIPIVCLYQKIFSFYPKKNFQNSLVQEYPGYFFGFHDNCPWSYDESKLLSHCYDDSRPLDEVERKPIQIGVFSHSNQKLLNFRPLSETSAWNWQQGSSAQWIGKNNKIIFNDIENNKCVSKIIDINGQIEAILPFHIANTTRDGSYAFCYSFARLGCGMPGYGYNFDHKLKEKELKNKSLRIVDLDNKNHSILFNLDKFCKDNYENSMKNSFSFFSHCISSLNSKRFIFLHRWINKCKILTSRLYSVGIDGSNLYRFPLEDCSHMAWFDDQTVLAYCKPINKESNYYLLKDLDKDRSNEMVCFPSPDGHPQVSFDCSYILSDTYPDRYRRQSLYIFDMKSNHKKILVNYRIPFRYRLKRRCDFHPRWSRKNKMVCFDSAHNGTRSLCIINVPFGAS